MGKSKYYLIQFGPKEDMYTLAIKVMGNRIIAWFITNYNKEFNSGSESITKIKRAFRRDSNLIRITEEGYKTIKEELKNK